jgi:hypothetical protein
MVLAMAQHQLKHTDEAWAALVKGTEVERTDLPKLESRDIGSDWLDWTIAHALLREAGALLHVESEAGALRFGKERIKQLKETVASLRAAGEKNDALALNKLAWILATSTDPALRDGRSAVGFAERAVAKTERQEPGILDTLAAAHAEAGEFAKAANVQREAIGLCQDEEMKSDLASRLKLYESNTPYRESW